MNLSLIGAFIIIMYILIYTIYSQNRVNKINKLKKIKSERVLKIRHKKAKLYYIHKILNPNTNEIIPWYNSFNSY